MISRLIQHGLLFVSINCLIYFFLYSALNARQARRRALWYLLPLVAALAILTTAALHTPAGARTNDHSVPSVAVFFLTADVYFAFGGSICLIWRPRRHTPAGP